MWEHRWHASLGSQTMPLLVAAFVVMGVLVIPGIVVLACGALNALLRLPASATDLARRFVLALIPIGISMWAAHLLYHFVTAWSGALPAIQRVLPAFAFATRAPTMPPWLTPAQFLLLDAGLLLTLYVSWRIAVQYGGDLRRKLALLLPWGVAACGLYGAGIWILLQPMEMRGAM
jgi:hypothetical protein